jgi:hypothetical protein
MNTDELLAAMEEDERADRVSLQTLASPVDYAKTHGIRPQMVYYYIRTGKLKTRTCECGRRVIVIAEADQIFKKGVQSNDSSDEEDQGMANAGS